MEVAIIYHRRAYEMSNGGPVAARGRMVLRITAFGLPTHHCDSAPHYLRGVQVFAAWTVRSVCCFPCFSAGGISGQRGHWLRVKTARIVWLHTRTSIFSVYLLSLVACALCFRDFEAPKHFGSHAGLRTSVLPGT